MSIPEFEQLLQRYKDGTCTDAERKWIENWMSQNKLPNENHWEQMSVSEKQSVIDKLFSRIDASIAAGQQSEQLPTVRKKKSVIWYAAAVLAIFTAFSIYFFAIRQDEQSTSKAVDYWAHIKVPQGQRKKVTLGDGTEIWLQGGSQLSYPATFNGQPTRSVKLVGEGYFHVAKNKSQPFIVRSRYLEAEVLGTSFNMQVYEGMDQQQITLLEGSLAVRAKSLSEGQGAGEIILEPLQAAVLHMDSFSLNKEKMPIYGSEEDFKAGTLQFEDTPLSEVLYRVAQTYGVKIDYDPARVAKHKVTGRFYRSDAVKEVIQLIAESTGAKYTWKDSASVVFNP